VVQKGRQRHRRDPKNAAGARTIIPLPGCIGTVAGCLKETPFQQWDHAGTPKPGRMTFYPPFEAVSSRLPRKSLEITWLRGKSATPGANPINPMTQGKFERYHRFLKIVVRLQNRDLLWKLEREIGCSVDYRNHRPVHDCPDNLTPADVYQGRDQEFPSARNFVRLQPLNRRRRESRVCHP
jgi:hypothetical protein